MNAPVGLNSAQQEAVLATEGPLLVLAGAGAGKTRVITERIGQIIKNGIAPERILAITFTNKAAAEMRERVHAKVGTGGPGPYVSTFHSLGLSIIKEHYKLLGYKRRPTIYDRSDSLREMKRALKEIGSEEIEARTALGTASKQKGEGITADDFAQGAQTHWERTVGSAWIKYEHALRTDSALDFDDLLLKAVAVLEKYPEIRAAYQERWCYIHIDEYQDTNFIQARLAGLLVGVEKNICAVGDIDQTIYSWRGAQIENLLQFERQYPGTKTVILEENYRSTQIILDTANKLIAKNNNRVEKNLYTKNSDGDPISLYMAFDEIDEAGFVARIIREGLAAGKRPRDFAVLYRANFQSRALEEQLLASNIEYQVLGTRFFERKEVKDALSFIRAALNETPADIARIANVPPRGIGKVTLLKMLSNQPVGAKVDAFKELLIKIKDRAMRLPPSQLLRFVITESGMERVFKDDKLEGAERLENLRELLVLAARYDHLPIGEGLDQFLESAALASDQDELKDDTDAVRLMTVHASKGLEFRVVFITGLEEGLFPYQSEDSDRDQEEERRLMYVAVTRAREKLYLTYASYRTVFGSKNATLPSSFLQDVPGEHLEAENPERIGRTIYLD